MEDDPVGQVVTDVQLVDGKIRVFFGPCCWHDLDVVAAVAENGEIIDPGTIDDLIPPGGAYSKCGRAKAMHEAIIKVADLIWDERDNPLIWTIVGNIESAAKLGNLSNNAIAAGVSLALGLDQVYGAEEIFDVSSTQRALCRMAERMTAFPQPLLEDEWDAVRNAYLNAFGVIIGALYLAAIDAIGRGTLGRLATLGTSDQAAVCMCPEEIAQGETTPDASGWYLGANLAANFTLASETEATWDALLQVEILGHDAYGTFLVVQSTPGDGTIKRMADTPLSGLVYPAHTRNAWTNTSDHLESINQAYPLISTLNPTIRASLATQRGYLGNLDGGSGGINGTTIATPPSDQGDEVLANILAAPNAMANLTVVEFRFVHNINSPSHA